MVKAELKRLLNYGIMRKLNSLYAAPCFIVKKTGETERLLMDYRKLKKICKALQYHIPSIFDKFNLPKGIEYFSNRSKKRIIKLQ